MAAQRRVLWLIGALLGLVVILAGLGALGFAYANYLFDQPGPEQPNGQPHIVMLEKGDGVRAISAKLEGEGLIADSRIFRFEVWRLDAGRSLKAGEYAVPSGASMRGIMTMLREGRVLVHKLTLPEGWTTAQALRLISADPVLEGPITRNPSEGSLLPDTYNFSRGETRDAMIARMEKDQRDLLAQLWPNRAQGLPYATPAQALILASIVEKETGIDGERARVAAVFVNRLKKGMRLQSDPTIIYGISKGEPLGRGIRQSEIQAVTAYNTYQIDGLPPTPIANPGRAAIVAVLNPLDTQDLYFVANGTGGHAFASNVEEHARNAQKWRAIERKRNNPAKP